jgi:tRNA threonylcarbamoyladenosine biosynthesis protein TsaB
MPAIAHALGVAGVSYSQLAGIVVADGPGSFTGLRIGFATAKGLMLDHDHLRLHAVPSLMSLAFGFRELADGPVAALYDAQRGDVFGAVYGFEEGTANVYLQPTLGSVTQLTELCARKPTLGVGDGAVVHGELVHGWTGRSAIGPPLGVPRAASLLGLMAVAGAAAVVEEPEAFEPEYGRLAEALVRLEAKQRGSGTTN